MTRLGSSRRGDAGPAVRPGSPVPGYQPGEVSACVHKRLAHVCGRLVCNDPNQPVSRCPGGVTGERAGCPQVTPCAAGMSSAAPREPTSGGSARPRKPVSKASVCLASPSVRGAQVESRLAVAGGRGEAGRAHMCQGAASAQEHGPRHAHA